MCEALHATIRSTSICGEHPTQQISMDPPGNF